MTPQPNTQEMEKCSDDSIRLVIAHWRARVETLEAQLKEAREAQQWISVGDRMPDARKRVLISCGLPSKGEMPTVYEACWWPQHNEWQSDEGLDFDNVTHWRELPPPPHS